MWLGKAQVPPHCSGAMQNQGSEVNLGLMGLRGLGLRFGSFNRLTRKPQDLLTPTKA